jgi:hypothetical protein
MIRSRPMRKLALCSVKFALDVPSGSDRAMGAAMIGWRCSTRSCEFLGAKDCESWTCRLCMTLSISWEHYF